MSRGSWHSPASSPSVRLLHEAVATWYGYHLQLGFEMFMLCTQWAPMPSSQPRPRFTGAPVIASTSDTKTSQG